MSNVKLGLVQMSMSTDLNRNVEKAIRMINEAAKKGANIVCLPELFNSPYFPQDENVNAEHIAEEIPGPTTNALSKAARDNRIILIGGSIYEKDDKRKHFNTTPVFDENGALLGRYRKIHVPHDLKFYEQNYFEKGNLGFKVFRTKYAMVGTMICYDQWFPEAARANALMDADVIFYPTAIGTIKGVEQKEGNWQEAWENVQRGHAIANATIISAVNRVGVERDLTFWGGSFVINQFGKTLTRGSMKEEVLVIKVDLNLGKEIKEGWKFFYNRRPKEYKILTKK